MPFYKNKTYKTYVPVIMLIHLEYNNRLAIQEGNYFMEETKDFADCIPKGLVEEIRKNGKEQESQCVFRVAKRGIINDIMFAGSYEETLLENRRFKGDLNEIGSYSTSCYLSTKCPEKFLGFLKAKLFKQYPCPNIVQGCTVCGLSQLTRDRLPNYLEDDHIDWWIYKGSFDKLIKAFTFYELCERGDLNEK